MLYAQSALYRTLFDASAHHETQAEFLRSCVAPQELSEA